MSKDVKTTLSEDQIRTLVQAAIKVKEHAYAPYSKFPVGAAVLSSNGQIYCGCNVENAAYPVGSCAEASAISAMVSAGQLQIEAIAVVGNGPELCTPCGACRQRIREFAIATTPIYVADDTAAYQRFTLEELLPQSFGPDNLSL